MKYLVTGACGFIGSNFADSVLKDKHEVINIDKFTSVSNNFLSLKYNIYDKYTHIQRDINDVQWMEDVEAQGLPDIIVHFAAESHVDRSCENVIPFIDTNITGTMHVTNFCIKHNIGLVYISTDEVYGSLNTTDDPFTEDTPLDPRNPYAASKASGEYMVTTLGNAHNWDRYAITRCSNNYGHWQDKTKLIPVCIKALMDGNKIPIYGEGQQIRDWVHVLDHCEAVQIIAERLIISSSILPKIYNVGGGNELTNLALAQMICNIMEVPYTKGITFIDDPRGNAHDFRYAIDSSQIQGIYNWCPRFSPMETFLVETIDWYNKNSNLIF